MSEHTPDYPSWICCDCGKRYGRKLPSKHATWHHGECNVCGEDDIVTEPRDFGHLVNGWQEHKQKATGEA